MCVLSIKVPIRKKSENLFNDPRMSTYIYMVSRILDTSAEVQSAYFRASAGKARPVLVDR